MQNPIGNLPIEEIHDKIKQDFLSPSSSKQELAFKALLPSFNRFVKDTVKRGDYAHFRETFEQENGRKITNEDYILNLSDIFFDPFLPLDLNEPDKYQPLLLNFTKKYIKTYM